MSQPRPIASRPVLRAFLIALCACAAASVATGPYAAAPDEAPRYTDEDLKPKPRPAPAQEPGGESAAAGAAPQPTAAPQTRPAVPQSQPAGQAPPGGAAAAAPSTPQDDSWMREWKRREETEAYWKRLVQDAEQRIAALQERLEYLERRKASIQNPYLSQPSLDERERKAEEGMDNAGRTARVQGQIDQARQELEEARRALEQARARSEAALRELAAPVLPAPK